MTIVVLEPSSGVTILSSLLTSRVPLHYPHTSNQCQKINTSISHLHFSSFYPTQNSRSIQSLFTFHSHPLITFLCLNPKRTTVSVLYLSQSSMADSLRQNPILRVWKKVDSGLGFKCIEMRKYVIEFPF